MSLPISTSASAPTSNDISSEDHEEGQTSNMSPLLGVQSHPSGVTVPLLAGSSTGVDNNQQDAASTDPDSSQDSIATARSEERSGKESSGSEVHWGVHWREPFAIAGFTLLAFALALTHHFVYRFLDGREVGPDSLQQAIKALGNALTILTVASLAAANVSSYLQHIWTVFRKKPLSLEAIDALFSLNTNWLGFFNFEVVRCGKVLVGMAIVSWLLPLVAITPPGTLNVVASLGNTTQAMSWPSFNWDSTAWADNLNFTPSELVLDVTRKVSQSSQILDFPPPALNSSFDVSFYGPAIQCGSPNSTELAEFDAYVKALATRFMFTDAFLQDPSSHEQISQFVADSMLAGSEELGLNLTIASVNDPMTRKKLMPNVEDIQLAGAMVLISAFDPSLYIWRLQLHDEFLIAIILGNGMEAATPDQFNNWPIQANGSTILGNSSPNPIFWADELGQSWTPHRLWVQTSSSNIICTLGNASYTYLFTFTNGKQEVTSLPIRNFTALWTRNVGGSPSTLPSNMNYMNAYQAFASMISGNITLQTVLSINTSVESTTNSTELFGQQSSILTTGLIACDEIANSAWQNVTLRPDWLELINSGENQSLLYDASHFNISLFQEPAYLCRNGSLAAAIEDMFANVTLGLLTEASLTSANGTTITVKSTPTVNIYSYAPLLLLLPYALGILFTFLNLLIGLYSLHLNGVAHSGSFSALLATTRNTELYHLFTGQSLGALPLSKELAKVRLQFGEITSEQPLLRQGGNDRTGYVGWGVERNVRELKKGKRYG